MVTTTMMMTMTIIVVVVVVVMMMMMCARGQCGLPLRPVRAPANDALRSAEQKR